MIRHDISRFVIIIITKLNLCERLIQIPSFYIIDGVNV